MAFIVQFCGYPKNIRLIMINKWNKKKLNESSSEGHIDFILSEEDSFLEIKKASEVIPSWYKDIPHLAKLKEFDKKEDFTVKRCIPILDALTAGYIFVTNRDIDISQNLKINEIKISGSGLNQNHITMHPITQLGDMPISDEFVRYAFKWGNRYIIKTPPGYSCIFTHPFNLINVPFYSLAAVVDTDTYIQPVLFPFLMKKFNGIIPAGTPIMQIIPFKRDNWSSKIYKKMSYKFKNEFHNATKQYESERYDKNGNPLGGMYKRYYRKKKKYL